MSTVVLAAALGAAAPAVSAWPGAKFTWTGPDGSVWDLGSGAQGVTLMEGSRFLTRARHVRYASSAPGIPGSRHRGHQVADLDPFWVVRVATRAGSQAWVDLNAAWWNTMRADSPGQFTVVSPNGRSRSIMLRYHDRVDDAFHTDPTMVGRAAYGITMLADDPFWAGPPVSSPLWRVAAGQPFIKTAAQGGSPGFRISPAQTVDTARWTNLGDVDAWPSWLFTGETTAPTTVAINGQTISVPPIADGDWVRVSTDPRRQQAVDSTGTVVTTSMLEHGFAPIPPGETVDVDISLTGPGSVQGTFTPRFYEPLAPS